MTGKKTIWVYLEDAGEGFIPAYKELCADTVRRFAGNIENHIISSKNIEEYLPGSQKDSHFLPAAAVQCDPRLRRDYIQALVLEKHGGLWIDADILVTEDIKESTFDLLERYDLVTARELNDPLTLILSRPGGSIIREWRSRMEKEIQDPQQAANWEKKGASIFQQVVGDHQAETAYFEDQGMIIKTGEDPGVFFTNTIKIPLKTFLKDHPAFISLSDLLNEPRYDKFDAFNYWSREKILNEDLLISSLFRSVLHSEYHLSDVEDPERDYYKEIGVIVPTIDRSDCLTDLVKSVNKYFPGISVYIGIQGEVPAAQRVLLEGFENVALYDLPYDYGLSATRNFLVKEVREKYILLCDDDFVFTEQTDLKLAYKILRSSPGIKIVGGLLLSYNYGEDSALINKQYTSFISLITRRTQSEIDPLVIPFEYLDMKRYFLDAENYYTFCDSVINYALIDKTIFYDHGLWWDEQFKIRGEHLDFYLRVQKVVPSR